jgi:hypothetical protein
MAWGCYKTLQVPIQGMTLVSANLFHFQFGKVRWYCVMYNIQVQQSAMCMNNTKGADLIQYHILFQSSDLLLISDWTQYCFYTSSDLRVYYFQLCCSLSHKFKGMELTPWSWVLLKKPPATQLFKNFWTLMEPKGSLPCSQESCHWSLSWAKWKGITLYIKMLKFKVTIDILLL